MVDITETFFARDRKTWRKWLSSNHDSKKEIWLVLYKKHVKEPCISYEDAVEESLCFGWIDGIMKRIDDRQHTIRFTPRRKRSIWSRSNLERMERLIVEERMTEAGMAIYRERDPEKCAPGEHLSTGVPLVPEFMQAELDKDPVISSLFNTLSPSHRKRYIYWVISAKREETRQRRMRKAFDMIKEGRDPIG